MLEWILNNVPWGLRLIAAVSLTVGISLIFARVFRRAILQINSRDSIDQELYQERRKAGEDPPPPAPAMSELSSRVLGMTISAFVFLLAFTLGSFWSKKGTAETALINELNHLERAIEYVDQTPPSNARAKLKAALDNYQQTLAGPEWKAMQEAKPRTAYKLQDSVERQVSSAMFNAADNSVARTPQWPAITDEITKAFDESHVRLSAVPRGTQFVPISFLGALAVLNIALVTIFAPARWPVNMFLLAMMAAATALMFFVLVETVNPYSGRFATDSPAQLNQE